ncbi:MAG: hypothetical protein MZW92_58590 [Comamonadaceae bacterium]|nr:hypothetical protein [Comamonadaceae bacterium]
MFLLHAADDGYGGLEHRASTALIAARARPAAATAWPRLSRRLRRACSA